MSLLGWLAALVLFLQLPIPLFWFVVHPGIDFWRRHPKTGFLIGLLLSWPPVTAGLFWFHTRIFLREWPPAPRIFAGLSLIACEGYIFWRVHRDLGTARLIGKTEVSGGGEIADRGIYGWIRHPRYVGSFLAILGACLLSGTRIMWVVAAIWTALTMTAIDFEERELHVRFGAAYKIYRRRVPKFFPSWPER